MDSSAKLACLFLLFYTVLCSVTERTTHLSIEDILPVNNTDLNKNSSKDFSKKLSVKNNSAYFVKKYALGENEIKSVDVSKEYQVGMEEILEIWNPRNVINFWDTRTLENLTVTDECDQDISLYLTGVSNGENWALRSKF